MGLPEMIIEFKARAETAVRRSQNGVVAVILSDDTQSGDGHLSYSYVTAADNGIETEWSAANKRYLNLVFKGAPRKVLVERIVPPETYTAALARLKNKSWNWLTVPGMQKADVKTIQDWITAQREAKKTFKAVLPCTAAELKPNHEGIVDFATEGLISGAESFTSYEYCARIAGILAGLSMTESCTYYVLDELDNITESTTPDEDIDSGKMILINDGEKIKIARGVNSLSIISGNKTEDMKKIKIIEGMDLMRDDIRTTFEENYIGITNSYDNKMTFIAAINQYFSELERQGVLYDGYENVADIDVEAQREWLSGKYDITDYSDEQIRTARTGSYVFASANVQFADAIEDLHFAINME